MSCRKSPNKKYVSRPGPPYPAQTCKDMIKIGNNRKFYKSVPDIYGIYKWKLIKTVNKKLKSYSMPKKRSPKRKSRKASKKRSKRKSRK